MPGSFGLEGGLKCAVAEYDFTKDGGAIGTIPLRGQPIPPDALIVKTLIYTEVACTSGGAATIALQAEAANDLLAATAVASFALNSVQDGVPSWAAANVKRMTAWRTPAAVVAAFALTGGKFKVLSWYVQVKS